ncbi:protein FAM32A-like isoform X1 [Panicum virgatum]|uniref:protein FAM32A-like isoform X1 n=2 Tax=Panicum virgatum TaxID=38727 RepID=UPI0019D6750C|nr:protein FAM32A-like isoform X1 [Panicum virgatum]
MSLFGLGREMSEYQNVVVGGRLKLKGKALDVKEGGIKKKKKKQHREESSQIGRDELQEGGSSELTTDPNSELIEADKMGEEEGNPHPDYDHLTPAERRYMEQKQKIDMQKLAKVANKSHRDRIQDFNQYLANLSEHYDIPKVGPG